MTTEQIIWLSEAIGLLVAGSGVIYTLYKYVVYPSWIFYRKIKAMSKDYALYDERIDAIYDLIKKELTSNGGSSLKDQVCHINNKVGELDGRNRAYLYALACPMWESNVKGECIWVNRALMTLLNRPEHDLLGNAWMTLIGEDDKEDVIEEWEHAIQQERPFSMKYCLKDIDDKCVMVHGTTVPIMNHKSEIVGYMGSIRELE